MNRTIFSVLALVAAVFVVGAAASSAGAAGVVPPNNTTEANSTTTVEESANESVPDLEVGESGTTEDPAVRVDSQVIITEWRYENGGFIIEFENTGQFSTTVTVAEAVQFSEGSGQGQLRSKTLMPGKTTVTIPVEPRAENAAVTLTTTETAENGYFKYLSTGQVETEKPPVGWEAAQALMLTGVVGSLGFTYRVVKKKRDDRDSGAERVV